MYNETNDNRDHHNLCLNVHISGDARLCSAIGSLPAVVLANLWDKWLGFFFAGPMPFLSPKQHCQSTEGNLKH